MAELEPIRVAALTSGRRKPSTRFRVRQHIPGLRDLGIEVREAVPLIDKYARLPGWPRKWPHGSAGPLLVGWQLLKLSTRLPGLATSAMSQITWLQRELFPGIPTLEGLLKKPIVFDVDDAVWLTPPWGVRTLRGIAERSRIVVVGNAFLAEWFARYSENVRVVPTGVDTSRFVPRSDSHLDRTFTVGWTGTGDNLPYLEDLERPLTRFLMDHPDSRLLVMADRPPAFRSIPADRMSFMKWSEVNEVEAVQMMDAGLMPLPDTDWTRGKSSFKMLQYLACGVPAIVSPVGMNQEVLGYGSVGLAARSEGEWYEALRNLYLDRDRAKTLGKNGREVVRSRFDSPIIVRQLADIFKEVRSSG